jgi:hypothetical protein
MDIRARGHGRKSAAHLAAVKPRPRPLDLPKDLPPDEKAIMHQILDALPNGYFTNASLPMLRCLVSHAATAKWASEKIDIIEDTATTVTPDYDTLLAIRARSSRMVGYLSTKLKLTPKSRLYPELAALIQAQGSSVRPWEERHGK